MAIAKRRIKSFIKRDSRITPSQTAAIQKLWPVYGLDITVVFNFAKIFNGIAPTILEIGFGSGKSLIETAKNHPENNYIGIEMHQPGIGALLLAIEQNQLTNLRVVYADAVEVLKTAIPDETLAGIQLFFPDPWPKRKHHKRRIIQTDFVQLLATKLRPQGLLHLATDWEHYAKEMMQTITATNLFLNLAGEGKFALRSPQRPITTKFEMRGERAGRRIWELQFSKRCLYN